MHSLTTSRLRSALRVLAVAALLLPLAACDSSESGEPNGNDTAPPAILSANSDGTTVSVTFSEALDPTSVTASAFTVTPGTSVASASGSGASVSLVLASALDDGERRTYTVTANGVRDAAGNVGNSLSATFTFGGGGSNGGSAIGAAYPNAGDSRLVFFNLAGDRFLLFNPVTGAVTDADDLGDVENGLIPWTTWGPPRACSMRRRPTSSAPTATRSPTTNATWPTSMRRLRSRRSTTGAATS